MERDKHGVSFTTDVFDSANRLKGYATQGLGRPDGGYFECDLISHVTGNLWQGGWNYGVKLPDDFKYVVSLYQWGQYILPEGCERFEFEMYDDCGGVDQETVDAIATVVNACSDKGKTLVHCQAGLNRSGLVTARALMLRGFSADVAVKLLRDSRCDMVLCNESFVEWLRSL